MRSPEDPRLRANRQGVGLALRRCRTTQASEFKTKPHLDQRSSGGPAVALDPQSPVFIVPSGFLRILNRDLAHAGIAKRSADGRTFDLHAFRTSLGTHLARAGVPLRTTQAVMRHSSPTLTANVYTDTDLLQVDAAVASLPSL